MATRKELEQQLTDKLIELLKEGKKLSAIKVYRAVTGKSLKESKEYIDQFAIDHAQNNVKSTEKCFIATACYQNGDALEVDLFRNYRDEHLMQYATGRWFVRAYYVFSPSLANLLSTSPRLKHLVRNYVLKPMLQFILND